MPAVTRREFLRAAAWAAGVWGLARGARGPLAEAGEGPAAPARPAEADGKCNVVFFLIDDMGWADLGCYGSTYHLSPILDRLAADGMRFTDAYAACPVCSPTRASILTGKYPARLHLTDFIPGHQRPWARLRVPANAPALPLEETTIPEALKAAGYVSGCFGKWHLGNGPALAPGKQGFDAAGAGGSKGDKTVAGLTDLALKFIEASKDRPFFLYLAHQTVHIPLEAPKELVDRHRARLRGPPNAIPGVWGPRPGQAPQQQANPTYAAMIEHLDRSVGRVLARLEELKLAGRTVVIFFSDNGGLIRMYTGEGEIVTSNAPLRAEKGTLYEGGIRVPLIVRWPGVVKGGTVCREPVTSVDFFPTLLELAGLKPPAGGAIDGVSLMPLLRDPAASLGRDAIYWHYPHYHHSTPAGAVRAARYKLIEFYEDGRCELYDLRQDVGEANDLAARMPEKAAELREKLAGWRKSVAATMPTPNADYDPARAAQWGKPAPPASRPRPR